MEVCVGKVKITIYVSIYTGGTDQMDAPYNTQGVPLSQLRKLQLSEDDRALMNKVKTQGKHTVFVYLSILQSILHFICLGHKISSFILYQLQILVSF